MADGTEASTASGASVCLRDVEYRVGIGGVAVILGDQVDAKRRDGYRRIVRDQPQARAEQRAGVRARTPHVQRVGGRQAVVEQLAERGQRARPPGRRTPHPARGRGRRPARARRRNHARWQCRVRRRKPAAPRRKVRGCRSFRPRSRTRTAPVAAQNACQAASSPASAPECAATIARPRGDPPTVRMHHRHIALGRAPQRPPQPRGGAGRLHQQRDDPGLGIVEGVLDVVGGVGDEFLAGGDRKPETEPAAGPQQRGERRAGMGDQADAAGAEADRVPGSPARARRARC